MRIVSLLPSGTEIVFALGLGDELVGRSHRCDRPEEAAEIPVVTSAVTGPLTAGPDTVPGHTASRPSGIGAAGCRLDLELLIRLEPDLVLVDGADEGTSSGCGNVREALAARGLSASVVGLQPRSLEGIFNSIATIGAFAEAEDEAVGLVELCRERLGELENAILERRLEGIASRRVVVLEALDPPVQSGRWLPELVRRAGGWELLGREGEEPEPTTWDRVRDVDPEIIVIALEGGVGPRSSAELREVDLPSWFDDLAAVRDGELFAVDGAGLLLRPGPRIVEGVAVLAELFDPEGFAGAGPEGAWIPLGPLGIGSA
jgi:iron complex transport system substrate-binding protein